MSRTDHPEPSPDVFDCTVESTELLHELSAALTDDSEDRLAAAETAQTLAAVDPDRASGLVDPLVAVATESVSVADTATRRAATHALVRVGRAHPEALAPHADALASLVATPERSVAENAAGICAVVAASRPDAVAGVREELLGSLERYDHAATVDALAALRAVAADDPGEMRPAIERLCRLLDSESPEVAAAACRALGPLAATDADRLAAYDREFATLLGAERPVCRTAAGRTLAGALPFAPYRFPLARERVAELLDAEKPSVRRAGADAVVSLAQIDPGAFDDSHGVALELRAARNSLPIDTRSRDAVDEGIAALEAVRGRGERVRDVGATGRVGTDSRGEPGI